MTEKYNIYSNVLYDVIQGTRDHAGKWVHGSTVDPRTKVRWDEKTKYKIINFHTDEVYEMTKEEIKTQLLPNDKSVVNAMLLGERNAGKWCLEEKQDEFRSKNHTRLICVRSDGLEEILPKREFIKKYNISQTKLNDRIRRKIYTIDDWTFSFK